ncbi:MAG TPA: M56 family peptidase [Porphyromonadaceae bacterium]|nr:M56 family peptidase [Porphyromonadaceae bacterium]
METFFIYAIKVNAALVFFYLLYFFLLRKDTFIELRRYYFLSAIVFSLAYPFFTVDALGNMLPVVSEKQDATVTVMLGESTMAVVEEPPAHAFHVNWKKIVYGMWLAGTGLLLLRFFGQLISILRIKRRSMKCRIHTIPVYHLPEEARPFSFFRWIFIDDAMHSDNELNQILLHEQVHVKQWHSVDILLGECVCIFCWWNPVAWLMKREIAINLEYLADSAVLQRGVDSRDYQYHLLRQTYHETAVQIVNNFNVSQLKQRIMMMNKTKSPARKLAKYFLVLPLAFLFVTANSVYARSHGPQDADEQVWQDKNKPLSKSDEVFNVVDTPPHFGQGAHSESIMDFIYSELKYPQIAAENGIEGRVIVQFIIEKDGRVSNAKIIRGIDPSLDNEAVRMVNAMPKWTPGEHKGEIVRVKYTLPVVFELSEGKGGKEASSDTVKIKVTDVKVGMDNGNEKVFEVVDESATFPGGQPKLMSFLNDNIQYPVEAQKKGIQGRVIVQFIVRKDGRIFDAVVLRGADPLLDAEALRLVNVMPEWIPGKLKKQPVNVLFTLPVVFSLQK